MFDVEAFGREKLARLRDLRDGARLEGNIRRVYGFVTVAVLLALVGGPLAYYIWGSFWTTTPGLGGAFTIDGYRRLFQQSVYETTLNTLVVAVGGTVLAVGMGVLAVIVAKKTNLPGRQLIPFILITQYLVPEFVLAIAWEFYAAEQGVVNQVLGWIPFVDFTWNVQSLSGIIVVVAVHYAGLVYLLSSGSIGSIPRSFEEAATISGASQRSIVREVVVPIAKPAILISTILVFTRLIQSFGAPIVLGTPSRIFVVSTLMYRALTRFPADFSFAASLGMIMLTVAIVGLYLQQRMTGPRSQYETVGGREDVTDVNRYDLGRFTVALAVVVFALLFLLYVMPLVVVFVSSFQQVFLGFNFEYVRWTTENYLLFLSGVRSSEFYRAVFNSLVISGVGAFTGMVIASMASYLIVKSDSPVGDFLNFLTLSPAAIPGLIIATAFLWIFLTYNLLGLYGTIWIIMLALTARFIVYGTRATNSSFRAIGTELEEAAQLSGANLLSIFREIFLPLIRPGFTAGFVLLFIDYMKVLTIPLVLQGGRNGVLATLLWEIENSGKPEASAALAVMMILLVLSIYGVVWRFTSTDITRI